MPGYLQMNYADHLRLVSVLTSGGFGVVHLADVFLPRAQKFGPRVVVKVSKNKILNEFDLALFRQEIGLMEYFRDHNNIAKILGFCESPFCIVMKYYKLGSLRSWIRAANERSTVKILNFTHDISAGLMALHEKGVVHLDLKPENILLDGNSKGEVFCVLTDFGISQVVTDEIFKVHAFRLARIRAISLNYAAPERLNSFRQRQLEFSKDELLSWDLYSLSICVFEMINGST